MVRHFPAIRAGVAVRVDQNIVLGFGFEFGAIHLGNPSRMWAAENQKTRSAIRSFAPHLTGLTIPLLT
jgi:hypothetical protein